MKHMCQVLFTGSTYQTGVAALYIFLNTKEDTIHFCFASMTMGLLLSRLPSVLQHNHSLMSVGIPRNGARPQRETGQWVLSKDQLLSPTTFELLIPLGIYPFLSYEAGLRCLSLDLFLFGVLLEVGLILLFGLFMHFRYTL